MSGGVNARDVIAMTYSGDVGDEDDYADADLTLAALRKAVGAARGDTITIAPDGTIGRPWALRDLTSAVER